MLYIIIGIYLFLLISYNLFLLYANNQIAKVESKLSNLFHLRNDLVPAIYEVSRDYVLRHSEVFDEIMGLRKQDFFQRESGAPLQQSLELQKNIHKEFNFLFKICNEHPKLTRQGNFLYLRDVVIERSYEIGKKMELYKKAGNQYNNLVKFNIFFGNIGKFWGVEKKIV